MKRKLRKFDVPLAVLIGLLLVIGLSVTYSASVVQSFKISGNTSYYLIHQLLYGGLVGLVVLYICSRIDYHWWQKVIPVVLFGSLFLLALVKMPGIGFSSGGASRWISLGPLFFQPAELAKLALIMYTAGWISKKRFHISNFSRDLLPALMIISVFAFLVLWQPDVGTMLAMVVTIFVMLFVGGADLKHLFAILGLGGVFLALLIKFEPYRLNRLTTFFNPTVDPLGIGYQINQAILAIGSGSWWGLGYGLSRQKYNYLPQVMGDSIFAVMAEELGFFRSAFILLLFLLFALRSFKISMKAPDTFGKMLGIGIACAIVVQAVINVGAIMRVLPLTGIPLPFFSYGSSSLIITLAECGILLNISRQTT